MLELSFAVRSDVSILCDNVSDLADIAFASGIVLDILSDITPNFLPDGAVRHH